MSDAVISSAPMNTRETTIKATMRRVAEDFRPLGRTSYWHAVREAWAHHHCAARAASLTFVTILSLVPLAALTVAVLEALGDPSSQDALAEFLGRHVFPLEGTKIADYIQSFASNIRIGALGPIGLASSLAVTYLLFANVERAFGEIWQNQEKRGIIRKFTVFWTLATLGPLLMAISVVQGAGLVHQFALFRILLPFLATSLLLVLVNRLMPNRRVPWSSALVGGVLSALLFETSKHLFALYFTKMAFGNYRIVYGRLALLPVLLVWIHLSWSAVLMGAVAARVLASPEEPKRIARANARLGLRVITAIAQWFSEGNKAMPRAELAARIELTPSVLDDVLTRLRDAGLLVRVSGDTEGFMPARPLENITAAQVAALFEEADLTTDGQQALDDLLGLIDSHTKEQLGRWSVAALAAGRLSQQDKGPTKDAGQSESDDDEAESRIGPPLLAARPAEPIVLQPKRPQDDRAHSSKKLSADARDRTQKSIHDS